MDKHTFKVGDRVFGQVRTGDKKVPGVFVKMGGHYSEGCIIRRDDGVSGIEPGLYWYGKHLTTHDTDFQVGDWVRYEQTNEKIGTPKAYGQIGKIERMGTYPTVSFPSIRTEFLLENLVKIQPPKEYQEMVIQEIESNNRRVHNVRECVFDGVRGWRRDEDNRVIYYPSTHWEPVEEWVKIEVRKSQWGMVDKRVGMLEVQKESDTYPDTCTLSWRYPQ